MDGLQETVECTEAYLRLCGLCSTSALVAPEISTLLVLRKTTRGRQPPETPYPENILNEGGGGVRIARVKRLLKLGLNLEKDAAGAATLQKLHSIMTQATRLVKRVTSLKHVLMEAGAITFLQALIITRVTYDTLYLWVKMPKEKK